MDSVTQLLLGASVAGVMAPAKYRRKALALGAALGTLPDLDVFLDFGGAIENFTEHRGFSHSLLLLPWVALSLWGALMWAAPTLRAQRWRWLALVQATLLTHPVLDAFTVYGTQLWWPLASPPVSIGSIFIIDPAYTLPLLVGVVGALLIGPKPRASFWLGLGLLLSSSYLAWTLFAQTQIRSAVEAEMAQQNLADAKVLVTPTPFNTLLWRIVVAYPDGDYAEGYYSLLDPKPQTRLLVHPGNAALLAPLSDHWAIARLRWFTHGFIAAEVSGERVVVKDLRMGVEDHYVFRFAVAERRDGVTVPLAKPEQLPWPARDLGKIREIWQRARAGQPAPTAAIGPPILSPSPLPGVLPPWATSLSSDPAAAADDRKERSTDGKN